MRPGEMADAWNHFVTNPLNISRHLFALKTIWAGVEKIILSVFQNERTAVKAGHAMSKDWTAGILTVQWLLTYFGAAKVIITGPTNRQVKEIVFNEIAKQYYAFLDKFPNQGFRRDWLTTNKLDFGPECFALGFTTRETGDMIGKFQGFHSPNILIVLTEAQDIPSATYKQIKGLITSKNSRILEIGNPIVEFGDFYEHCTAPRYGYNVIHLPCFDSPNVIAKKEIIPGMATIEYIERMQHDCGPDYRNDAEYQSRVMAEFPQQSKHAWIPLLKIKESVGREFPASIDDVIVAGLDTAGVGDDETVFSVFKGSRQIKQDCFRKVLTPETVGWARNLIENEQITALAVDEGYNKAISSWIDYEKLEARVISVNFGAESPIEKFENFGTYMWHLARESFMAGAIGIVDDPILITQLASRRVEITPKGKLRLVSKKKEGRKSPDRADALVMAWYMRMIAVEDMMLPDLGENEASRMHVGMEQIASRKQRGNRENDIKKSENEWMDADSLRF